VAATQSYKTMMRRRIYLGTIRHGREQSERSGGPNGAQDFFSDLGQIHWSSLGEQEEREQEENPIALDSSLAQIAIENERIPQHASKGKQVRLHLNLRRRDPQLTAAFHIETTAFTLSEIWTLWHENASSELQNMAMA